jgi:hypothetical protein
VIVLEGKQGGRCVGVLKLKPNSFVSFFCYELSGSVSSVVPSGPAMVRSSVLVWLAGWSLSFDVFR